MFSSFMLSPDLRNLRKFYRKAPRKFSRASAGMLNNLAFQTRSAALLEIASDMTIRSDRFVASRMRVERARAGSINTQQAEVGSVPTARFSGWLEQETGKPPQRNRVFNIAARRGNEQNAVIGKARLKPSNQFYTANDFAIRASSEDHRTIIFLQLMSRHQPGKAFVLQRRFRKMRKGIYTFTKRGKIRQLQEFGVMKVKRKPWMAPARKGVMTRANIRKQWARSIASTLRL